MAGVVARPTITITATPDYSIGDVVGGIITLSGVMYTSGRMAELRSVMLKDAAGVGPALTLIFFRSAPVGGTYADNGAVAWHADDPAKIVGIVKILAADWYTVGTDSIVCLGDIGQIHGSATKDLSLLILADSAYNAAAATDLTAEFAYDQR